VGVIKIIDKLLISEPPLQVLPGLAKAIGLNEAIVLQQLHFLLRHSKNVFDGRKWICLSYDEWRDMHFPFWSAKTIFRVYKSLILQHFAIATAKHNRYIMDTTRWYTIEYDALAELAKGMDPGCEPAGGSDPCQATLLLPEQPLQVLPSLAVAVGLNEGIVLQQLHFLLRLSSENRDDQRWVFLSYEALVEKHLSCMSERTIRRAIKTLENAKLLLSTTKYNRHFLDNTKWYAIDYAKLNQVIHSRCEDNSSIGYNVRPKGQSGQTTPPETIDSSIMTDSAIMSVRKDKVARRPDKMARRPDNLATLRPDKLARLYKEEESKKLRDDNREAVVVVSSAPPTPSSQEAKPPSGESGASFTVGSAQVDGESASPPAASQAQTDDTSCVAPGIPAKESILVDEDAIVESLRDTPLYNLISKAAIRNAIAAYCHESHPDYQPESPVEGVRRLCSWMVRIVGNPDMPAIRNPAGFLVALARKGMDKPACIATQEVAAERRRKDIDESRRYSVVRQLQSEYPGVVVEDVLRELPDLQYPLPTDEQMKAIRAKLETAQVRTETARLKALADCRTLFAAGGQSGR